MVSTTQTLTAESSPLQIRQAVSGESKVHALKARHAAIREANAALVPVTLDRVFTCGVAT